jgi:hypothetical protein
VRPFAWTERAYRDRSYNIMLCHFSPTLVPLQDSRLLCDALRRRIGLGREK